MPMAGDIRDNIAAIRSHRAPAIVRARQNGIKFAANHLFDQPTNRLLGIAPSSRGFALWLGGLARFH
jgi:hypothetical protein